MLKLRWGVIVLLVVGCLVLAPVAGMAEEKVIKIGSMYPMTGRAGLYGLDSVDAAEMAVAEINAKGGVAGYKLEFINTDSKAKPDYAVMVAKRYIDQDKVHFLFGVVSSAVGLAVTEVSKQAKKIFIGTDHASTQLTADKFQPYYFRVSNNTFQSMAAGALYLKELNQSKPWQTIAYVGPDYAYGHDQWNELKYNLDRFGCEVQGSGRILAEALCARLHCVHHLHYKGQARHPRVRSVGRRHGRVIKQATPYGLFEKVLFFSPDAGGNYEVMSATGAELPLGLVLSARHHNNWPETAANKEYVQKFFARTGRYPTYAAEGAYAGILAIAQAVEKVGNPNDTEALVKALEGMKIKLPEDPDDFTSYIDPATHQIVQVQAIGVTVPNDQFPPAKRMLGNWKVYKAEELLPPKDFSEKK